MPLIGRVLHRRSTWDRRARRDLLGRYKEWRRRKRCFRLAGDDQNQLTAARTTNGGCEIGAILQMERFSDAQ